MAYERGLINKFLPLVNLSKCEGKAACVDVCPYDVFEIGQISKDDFSKLPFLSKIKNKVHGGKVAYVTDTNKCMGCGLCVKSCPEKAISVKKL